VIATVLGSSGDISTSLDIHRKYFVNTFWHMGLFGYWWKNL